MEGRKEFIRTVKRDFNGSYILLLDRGMGQGITEYISNLTKRCNDFILDRFGTNHSIVVNKECLHFNLSSKMLPELFRGAKVNNYSPIITNNDSFTQEHHALWLQQADVMEDIKEIRNAIRKDLNKFFMSFTEDILPSETFELMVDDHQLLFKTTLDKYKGLLILENM